MSWCIYLCSTEHWSDTCASSPFSSHDFMIGEYTLNGFMKSMGYQQYWWDAPKHFYPRHVFCSKNHSLGSQKSLSLFYNITYNGIICFLPPPKQVVNKLAHCFFCSFGNPVEFLGPKKIGPGVNFVSTSDPLNAWSPRNCSSWTVLDVPERHLGHHPMSDLSSNSGCKVEGLYGKRSMKNPWCHSIESCYIRKFWRCIVYYSSFKCM